MDDPRDLPRPSPSLKLRVFFWFILGAFSVFFAEVTVASAMFPFFDPFSVLVTCPLYALHILVLSTIVLQNPRPRFASLYFAGAIFGLYEAYITKVLWHPPWNEKPVILGGVAILESLMLVLFYHAMFAFVIPLVAAERLLTGSSQISGTLRPAIARWLDDRRFAVAFAAICGIIQTAGSPSLLHTMGSTVSTSGFMLVLVVVWKRVTRGQNFTFAQLLPGRWGLAVLGLLMATQYIGLGVLLRPEKLPGMDGQATIWGCYLFFGAWLIISLWRTSVPETLTVATHPPLPWQHWLWYAVTFAVTSTAFQPLAVWLRIPIFVALWGFGIITGCVLLVGAIWQTVRRST